MVNTAWTTGLLVAVSVGLVVVAAATMREVRANIMGLLSRFPPLLGGTTWAIAAPVPRPIFSFSRPF